MSFELPEDWYWLQFKDLLEIPLRNGIYKKKEFHGRGVKIVNMGELFAFPRLKDVGMKRVELTKKEIEKSSLQSGDLIFARRSLTAEGAGKCTIVLEVNEPTTFESSIIRARLNNQIANPEFYYYLFNSKFGKWLLGTILRQVAVAGITGTDLGKLQVPVPPISTQNKIAKHGSLLDDKIELNTQTNQTLEQIAQAIFKSWFVDFEPVKVKIAVLEAGGTAEQAELAAMSAISAKDEAALKQLQAEQPDAYAELAQTAALFPSAMEESELGEIPEGWKPGTLADIASLAADRIAISKVTIENYVSTENMLENKRGLSVAAALPGGKTVPLFEEGHILVSNIRPYFKKIWFARFSGGRSPDVLGFMSNDSEAQEFLFNFLYQDLFFDFMMTTSKGAKMPRGDKDAIMGYELVLPSQVIQRAYSNLVKSYYEIIDNLNSENSSLSSIRDTLLPKLLTGDLSIINSDEVPV